MGPTTAFAGAVTLVSFIAYLMPGTVIEQVRIAIERAGITGLLERITVDGA